MFFGFCLFDFLFSSLTAEIMSLPGSHLWTVVHIAASLSNWNRSAVVLAGLLFFYFRHFDLSSQQKAQVSPRTCQLCLCHPGRARSLFALLTNMDEISAAVSVVVSSRRSDTAPFWKLACCFDRRDTREDNRSAKQLRRLVLNGNTLVWWTREWLIVRAKKITTPSQTGETSNKNTVSERAADYSVLPSHLMKCW